MKKKRIVQREPCRSSGNFHAHVTPLLQRIYLQRGITEQGELQKELAGLPAPEQFKGMDQAVALLVEALHQQNKISVIGDFDADGATSSALAIHALRAMGFQANFLVPNRFKYGYGLTPEIVTEAIRLQQPDLILTVDNGISSQEGVMLAHQHNIRVLITDHHLPGKGLPLADAIVNPNQAGCEFPSKNLAGVGVIFYVMSALRKKLREENYFQVHNTPEPNMADYLDLVALGTVADVVPLDFYNRILVQQGLLRIRSGRCRTGIQALIEIGRRNPRKLIAEDLGFAVAPRLNAAGRMDDMSTGIRCLLSDNLDEAQRLAIELDKLNRDRKSIEQGMQQEAAQAVATLQLQESGLPWGLCVFDESWHPGIVGLLASRLKERYHRPVIAFAPHDIAGESTEPTIKGSARSIPGLHIRDALEAIATTHPGLLEKFGGHAMAAGLSLPRQHLADFSTTFDHYVRQHLDEAALQSVLLSDGELAVENFQLEQAQVLREGGPWGQHFPAPLFHGLFTVMHKRPMGEEHLRLVLQPVYTHTTSSSSLLVDAVVFFMDKTLRESIVTGDQLTVVYRLDVNDYQGSENVQLLVEYLVRDVM